MLAMRGIDRPGSYASVLGRGGSNSQCGVGGPVADDQGLVLGAEVLIDSGELGFIIGRAS